MALAPGVRLGPCEITAPIGAGGMGEVYKARDTRLDRTVAIKVLPAHRAQNAEFLEGETLSARLAAGALPHTGPPAVAEHQPIEGVVKKCLAKDPEARWQSAADLRSQLQWLAENPAQLAPARETRNPCLGSPPLPLPPSRHCSSPFHPTRAAWLPA